MLADHLGTEIEANAHAFGLWRLLRVCPVVQVEDRLLILRANALPFILHPDHGFEGLALSLATFDADHDPAAGRAILDGIAQQVLQDLLNPQFIIGDQQGPVARLHNQAMARTEGALFVDHLLDQCNQIGLVTIVQVQLAVLHLRKGAELVD